MPLFTESQLRTAAATKLPLLKSRTTINAKNAYLESLESSQKVFSRRKDRYDFFLSHSYEDKELVYGLYCVLQNLGFEVFIDWLVYPELRDRKITKKNADIIRQNIKKSNSLLFAFSENAILSQWAQWEIGLADGALNSKVAIVPIKKSTIATEKFDGQEYLGLYRYVTLDQIENSPRTELRFNRLTEDGIRYRTYKSWLDE